MNAIVQSTKRQLWHLWLKSRGQVLGKLALLQTLQGSPAADVSEFQTQRLREILYNAWLSVPFWRERLEEYRVVRDGIVDLDLFHEMPPLNRAEVQANFDRMLAQDRDPRHCEVMTTSGSTGNPTRLLHDREYNEWNRALKLLFDGWTGYVAGEPQVRLWGMTHERIHPPMRVSVGRWLRGEHWLNGFFMSEEDMRNHLDVINRVRPRQIFAYVESLHQLSEFAVSRGEELHAPDSLVTSAGMLFPRVRGELERRFRSTVHNRYGAVEAGDIAMERRGRSGLYVAPTNIVEILGEDGRPVAPGEIGPVVVTVLTNNAMPLLRYRLGDLARMVPPEEDDIGWPRLSQLIGRVNDSVRTPSGGRIHGIFFEFMMEELPFVHRYQIHQTALDRLVVRIIPASFAGDPRDVYAPDLSKLTDKIQKEVGPVCRIEYEFVPRIDPVQSGKFRHVISDVVN